MKFKCNRRLTRAAAFSMGMVIALVSCASDNAGDLEITGIVFDASTQKPIEGAYVVATYKRSRGTIGGHSSSYCYMTRGMYTGADGKYHLPVTAIDYGSPAHVDAIKPGYYLRDSVQHKIDIRKDPKAWFSNRHIYLAPQDTTKPEFRFARGDVYCDGAETEADASAAAEFLTIELAEITRLGAKEQWVESVKYFLKRQQSLPTNRPNKK